MLLASLRKLRIVRRSYDSGESRVQVIGTGHGSLDCYICPVGKGKHHCKSMGPWLRPPIHCHAAVRTYSEPALDIKLVTTMSKKLSHDVEVPGKNQMRRRSAAILHVGEVRVEFGAELVALNGFRSSDELHRLENGNVFLLAKQSAVEYR